MNIALLVLHVILSLGIITLVLLQKGAGASAGAAFGGGGAGSVFGASGSSNFLSKSTAILATGFFLNSIALAYLAAHRDVTTDSVIDSLMAPKTRIEAPAVPADTGTEVVPPAVDSVDEIPPPAPEVEPVTEQGETAVDTNVDTTAPATDVIPPADSAEKQQ